MTQVKICSITNAVDGQVAIDAGADYLGFIAVPNTPRYVTPERYREICGDLSGSALKVLVVRAIADAAPYAPQIIQYYGGALSDAPRGTGLIPVIRPRTIDEIATLLKTVPSGAVGVVVDAHHPDKLGGAGVVTDWAMAAEAVRLSPVPVFLAGGLTPANVADAISSVHPFGVDTSSGVELRAGAKDHSKVRAFISAAKAAR